MTKIIATVMIVPALALSAWTLAADREKPVAPGTQGMQSMPGMPMMQGMPGMHGMMGGACPMMGGAMMGGQMPGAAMPQLPSGNEKLQLQMWGEMMQKMGEIASKYAAQVK